MTHQASILKLNWTNAMPQRWFLSPLFFHFHYLPVFLLLAEFFLFDNFFRTVGRHGRYNPEHIGR